MTSIRRQLVALIERRAIPREQIERAVRLSGLYPSGRAWCVFLDRLLLWLGCLALACSMLFFIAYNWSDMGRWLRFGLVEAVLVLAVAIYWIADGRGVVAQAALTTAALLLGVLLALFGQVYQTGADPWQLFFYWALLMLPWVLVARFAALWVLWLGLLNLAILLYYRTWGGAFSVLFGSEASALWGLFLLNTAALALWELGARHWRWLMVDWARRLVALGSGIPITLLLMMVIVDEGETSSLALLVYPLWLALIYGFYRYWMPELFMLAGGCLSAIVITVVFLARHLLWQAEAAGFLFLSLAVLGLGAAAIFWLKRLHAEMHS
ncbi:hypothetical protein L861_22965 [Litchfieldella anticariensis FP35 = DSM 16096]|uniref:DUF2157 domain-containing protein n=1 Tax=Litchfieldella anticariensis (strain DSM 16096 / CECT 5854 / CIP 108499 / LMG 22089 / FP35) TaxID=1121939 RepID=S2L607_LITA3|nr:DUF2157 domain-containing protein [Halomonas anticariensis]EPC03174.1 hypothetical protein L861_22965 [Halomonas anticariensis FP35 = DSM 16096]